MKIKIEMKIKNHLTANTKVWIFLILIVILILISHRFKTRQPVHNEQAACKVLSEDSQMLIFWDVWRFSTPSKPIFSYL